MSTTISDNVPRKRDSVATRKALLDAARELFGAQGYDDTTLREIGERAGADASLIARYFGNKAALYIAVVATESLQYRATTISETVEETVHLLRERTDRIGVGPISQALLDPSIDPEIRAAAADRISKRLIDRIVEQMDGDADNLARLRAEVAVASLIGTMFMRGQGVFPAIADAAPVDLDTVLVEMLRAVLIPE
jgi:AcrR family transcriptional regulator